MKIVTNKKISLDLLNNFVILKIRKLIVINQLNCQIYKNL